MSDTKIRARPTPAYDADFYAWTQDQAARLREGRPNSIDWENVAEEIETLGRSDRREIRSHLLVLLTHLLKWPYQSEQRSNSWRASIRGARQEIAQVIRESPSLKRYPGEQLKQQYDLARLMASGETGLREGAFPRVCPLTVEEVLDPDFLPDQFP